MRKSYMKVSALMVSMVILLTGCASDFPEMTPEEEQLIGEYAANILLRSDANNRSRLVSREEVAARELELSQKENEIIEQPQSGMEPVDDTPVIEIGQDSGGDVSTGTFEEFYELPTGVTVTYLGNEVCNSYPSDQSNDYFALDAAEGRQLLVLKFRMQNQSQATQNIDLLSQSSNMRVTVNGSGSYNILTTMLIDDMSTYVGDIPKDGTVDVVLLSEMENDIVADISAISISLKNDAKTCTIQLQ